MSLVSIIIPVYNVEKYLPQCLDSVINQTYKNLEIICVNDCSADNSLEILEKYSNKDARIKIVNRENNGGLSEARNSGLKIATGDYIYFLDSDDWIDNDYIEKMLKSAVENNAKVVLNTNIISQFPDGNTKRFCPENTQNNIENKFLDAKKSVFNIIWNSWAYLWNRKFLNEINARFPHDCVVEDMYFQAMTFSQLDKFYVIRQSAYNYRMRSDSITADLKNEKKAITENYKMFNRLYDDLNNKNLLNKISIRIFILFFPSFNNQEKYELYTIMKNYFQKAEKYIFQNAQIYDEFELNFIKDLLYDFDKVMSTDYKKQIMLAKVKRQMAKHGQ